MKTSILGLFIIIMSAQWTFAQNSTTEQEIINLSKEKWQRMSDKEAVIRDNIFHEKAVFVHIGGNMTKEHELNFIRR